MFNILTEKLDSNNVPVIFLIKQGKVLIGLRNYTSEKWKDVSVWTIPGGSCDEGETIEETLRREVYEEVGIKDFTIGKYLGVVSGARESDTVHVFLGNTESDAIIMEPEKFSEWKFIKPGEIPENFINMEQVRLLNYSI